MERDLPSTSRVNKYRADDPNFPEIVHKIVFQDDLPSGEEYEDDDSDSEFTSHRPKRQKRAPNRGGNIFVDSDESSGDDAPIRKGDDLDDDSESDRNSEPSSDEEDGQLESDEGFGKKGSSVRGKQDPKAATQNETSMRSKPNGSLSPTASVSHFIEPPTLKTFGMLDSDDSSIGSQPVPLFLPNRSENNPNQYEHDYDSEDDFDYEPSSEEDDDQSDSDEESGYVNRHPPKDYTEEEIERAAAQNISLVMPECYLGADGFEWFSEPANQRVERSKENVTGVMGVKGPARSLGDRPSPLQIWDLLIDNVIIAEVVKWTNIKLASVCQKIEQRPLIDEMAKKNLLGKYRETNFDEIRAFIALLMLSSIYKAAAEDIYSLFSSGISGRQIFRAVMCVKRFKIICACIRFDDPETRAARKAADRAAPISFIFERFVKNCQALVSLSDSVCVDDMLVPFRGRCKFRMYMPAKPAKYGIKIQCLADARNSYFYSAYIYTGQGSDGIGLTPAEQELSIPTQSVVRLVKTIQNSGRNVTADEWYTSVQLCRELSNHGLTLVGAMKKNKREIPPSFQASSKRDVKDAKFGFSGNMTLLSFVPKKNKNVILISTKFQDKAIDPSTGKPEMITFYNKTKGGVDALDRKCSVFSSKQRSVRWPTCLFFRIVEISAANTHILYLCYRGNPLILRFKFVEQLALELMTPHLFKRRDENIRHSLKTLINDLLVPPHQNHRPCERFNEEMELPIIQPPSSRKTCQFCHWKLKRKTSKSCCRCGSAICLEHSKLSCPRCTVFPY